MGNIFSDLEITESSKKINDLTLKNEAMEKQVKIMKEMLKLDDDLIKVLENENKELKATNTKLGENKCVICNYFDKQ